MYKITKWERVVPVEFASHPGQAQTTYERELGLTSAYPEVELFPPLLFFWHILTLTIHLKI